MSASPLPPASPVALLPEDPGYPALADAALAPARAALGNRVQVRITRMDTLGSWAFVQGALQAADGGRPDFGGTSFAERASAGGMSDLYVVLLRRDPTPEAAGGPQTPDGGAGSGTWQVIDHAIGPADVAWLSWPTRHAAPRQLFGF